MIVDADDGAGSVSDRLPENLSWVDETLAGRSGGHFAGANESVFSVKTESPEFFNFQTDGS